MLEIKPGAVMSKASANSLCSLGLLSILYILFDIISCIFPSTDSIIASPFGKDTELSKGERT